MITIRCRLLQTLEFLIIISVFWVISVFLFWQIRGPCDPSPPPVIFNKGQVSCGGVARDPVKQNIPVYVVEEHHEVLLYWFDAAEKGFVKKQGNVLLHIDGHIDGATPERRDILPMFRWPSLRDIYNMMQKNDVFIVAAAFTGLIKRYIWVRPPWDITDGMESDHMIVSLKLGTLNKTDDNGTVIEDFCMCARAHSDNVLPFRGETCATYNLTEANSDVIEIDRGVCQIKVDDAVAEVVSEAKAIELLNSGQWITSLDSVILDIDEDYYAVEPAVQPLYDVSITEERLQYIQYNVENIFCASQPWQEREADKYYAYLLDTVINLKQICLHAKNNTDICKDTNTLKAFIKNSFDHIYAGIHDRNLKSILCGSELITKRAIRGLINRFLGYSPEQLKALKEVGICFVASPRTLIFDPDLGMRTCDGYNRPGNTAVQFHTPTDNEVTFRTSQLKLMLSSEYLYPGIVSVCRSVRDGYTPRHLFHRIEKDVLGVLKDAFKTIDDTSIHYDSHLLGGVTGWYKRH